MDPKENPDYRLPGLEMRYFILKPGGTSMHARASRAALRGYAGAIAGCNPCLANDLRKWSSAEAEKSRAGNSEKIQEQYVERLFFQAKIVCQMGGGTTQMIVKKSTLTWPILRAGISVSTARTLLRLATKGEVLLLDTDGGILPD